MTKAKRLAYALFIGALLLVSSTGCSSLSFSLPWEKEQQSAVQTDRQTYEAVVAKVVDGDTIHIEQPVMGTKKIRLLSIDTPEKNYNGKSQGKYAEQATEALKELLPSGTSIIVEPGEDPIDSYGRLLAHIHKEGMNVNEEMVRLGWAVPFLIYPNFSYADSYLAAATTAKTQGAGIWNPKEPIKLLPYEFRMKNPEISNKIVGSYKTKRYVPKNQWRSVPVEERVFFFTLKDAEKAGFRKQ
ncbi:thermonuclease family protein [Paenibacillus turpanensis]|uniref:thermonuclease family protein n=1 Tax=Paenibacillus turpanensis TaxID=2689078 RepID=UPI001408A2AD|nr:thermonuclease family protein [Paenibacillus turpanensis]